MVLLQASRHLLAVQHTVYQVTVRNIGVTAAVSQKPQDPIQKLFLDKVREYSQKSKSQGGALVDATAETKKKLQDELMKLEKQYSDGKGGDLTKFPTFNFTDPPLDPINMEPKH